MTEALFRTDAYRNTHAARVVASSPAGIVLDRSAFYVRAGGQPGDTGTLTWNGTTTPIADTVKGEGGVGLHVPAEGAALPPEGAEVMATLDWDRRHRLMRMHSSLHLLCSLIPGAGVTGGQIGADRSRLDFDLAEPPTKEWLTERLNALIAEDHAITETSVAEEELDANPGLVRTLSVQPPRGAGRIRLVRIGDVAKPVDLQPCGGTHVRGTAEIGGVVVQKLENKGKANRRVYVALADQGGAG